MSSLVTLRMTRAEARQLLGYLQERERTDWYYSPRKDFERRHSNLRTLLMRVLGFDDRERDDHA